MSDHGKLHADQASASIYCLYEEGVPVHVGQTTIPVEVQAEEDRLDGKLFTSFSTLECLAQVSADEIEHAERRWSNRLGMDNKPTGEVCSLRSAMELLGVLAVGLALCF